VRARAKQLIPPARHLILWAGGGAVVFCMLAMISFSWNRSTS